VTLGGSSLGSAAAASDGSYATAVTVPGLASGTYTLSVSCGGASAATTLSIGAVAGAAGVGSPGADPGQLPYTGANSAAIAAVGLGLAAAGAGLVVVARRRRPVGV
jgi:LPXTG-motif cell wall-anchored protein